MWLWENVSFPFALVSSSLQWIPGVLCPWIKGLGKQIQTGKCRIKSHPFLLSLGIWYKLLTWEGTFFSIILLRFYWFKDLGFFSGGWNRWQAIYTLLVKTAAIFPLKGKGLLLHNEVKREIPSVQLRRKYIQKNKTIWKKNSPNTGLSVSNTRTPDGLGSNQGDSSEAQPTPWWALKPAEKSKLISNSAHLAPGFQETGRGHIIDTQFIKALLDLQTASKLPRAKAWPASLGLHRSLAAPGSLLSESPKLSIFAPTSPFLCISPSSSHINEKFLKMTPNNSFVYSPRLCCNYLVVDSVSSHL